MKDNHNALLTKKMFNTNENQCYYCETPLTLFTRTRDHIKPKREGHKLNDENKVWACHICNTCKGHKTLTEWKTQLQNLVLTKPIKPATQYLLDKRETIIKNIDHLMQTLPCYKK